MSEYLTIKESAKHVNRSEITIRRFIRKVMMSDEEVSRKVIKLEELPRGYIYKLHRKSLEEYFLTDQEADRDFIPGKIDHFSDELPPIILSKRKKDVPAREALLTDNKLTNQLVKSLLDQLVQKENSIALLEAKLADMEKSEVTIELEQSKTIIINRKGPGEEDSAGQETVVLDRGKETKVKGKGKSRKSST